MTVTAPSMRRLCATLLLASATAVAADQVSVTFGKDAKEDGIKTTVWSRPGSEKIGTYAGKTGLQTDLVEGAWGLWGDVRDDFIHGGSNRVKVSIEYWDKKVDGEMNFKFFYDSAQKAMSRAPSIIFEGSNTWKTASFILENAAFGGRQENGADFKLFCTDTDFCVRSVVIEKVPEVIPTARVGVVPEKASMHQGERRDFVAVFTPAIATDKFITWSSSDPQIATVNSLGQVTAVAAGKAVITATHDNGQLKADCPVSVTAIPGSGTIATRAGTFLDSIGINTAVNSRGENMAKTIECLQYTGIRWVRGGVGSVEEAQELHKATGVRFSVMFGGDINRFLRFSRQLAQQKLLIAFEGPNEPNNWGITYQDVHGGGRDSWVPIAKLQRDFYNAVKEDPALRPFPVWHLTEGGAETDNVGLQFLAIPKGANIAMPDGTRYADSVDCHNYICHPNWSGLHDNQSWMSSDPTPACRVDGLYGEYGVTWAKKFKGFSEADLLTVPRVTTETGITLDGEITEEIQGRLYSDIYLDQFKQGWSHTSIYILRDRVDEGGNQTFGFYRPDYKPRKAATYLHNLTTILADTGYIALPGRLNYSIANQPATVHDLLLQKTNKKFYLVVWGERYKGAGADEVTVNLGATFKTVNIYDQTVGTDPVQTLKDVDAVKLSLTTNVMVIEL